MSDYEYRQIRDRVNRTKEIVEGCDNNPRNRKPLSPELSLKSDLCPDCKGEGVRQMVNPEVLCLKCKGKGRL